MCPYTHQEKKVQIYIYIYICERCELGVYNVHVSIYCSSLMISDIDECLVASTHIHKRKNIIHVARKVGGSVPFVLDLLFYMKSKLDKKKKKHVVQPLSPNVCKIFWKKWVLLGELGHITIHQELLFVSIVTTDAKDK